MTAGDGHADAVAARDRGHVHDWLLLAVKPYEPLGEPVQHTVVLARCRNCGEPAAWKLWGRWTMADLEIRR